MVFSNRLDAPAEKIRAGRRPQRQSGVPGRPGVAVRFYGANFCNSAHYLDKEWSKRLADRMTAAGFNAIRLHHHDGGLSQRASTSSTV